MATASSSTGAAAAVSDSSFMSSLEKSFQKSLEDVKPVAANTEQQQQQQTDNNVSVDDRVMVRLFS